MSSEKNKKKVQVLIAAQGEVLILKLVPERGGFWQNITGGVDDGETFIEAAARELWEETGFESRIFPLEFEFNFLDRFNFNVTERAFFCLLDHKREPLISHEHQAYKWLKFDEVKMSNYKFPTNFEAFLKLKAILK